MLTPQEKQRLTLQLEALKEKRADFGRSSNNVDEADVTKRLKNIQRTQIQLQTKIARMKKNGTLLQANHKGKVMMDKKTSAEDVTNKAVGKHSGGNPSKVMLDKTMKAKDVSPTKLGKFKEKKAYEGFDPDLLECIKRRDAWDKLASHYIYEADEIYNNPQSPFQDDEEEDFNFDVDIDADGDGQQGQQGQEMGEFGDEEEGEGDEMGGQEMDLVKELKLLNQKILQLKDFADSITPDDMKDVEQQQSKLQQIVDDGQQGQQGQQGEEGFEQQGGESQGIEGLDDEEAIGLQGQQGGQQGFNPGGEQGGQNFKAELGAEALSGMKMGGGKKKKSPEIAMEDVREAILRRNFWDATAKNLIRLEEYVSSIDEGDREDATAIAAIKMSPDTKDVEKAKEEISKNIKNLNLGENDDPFLPAEAIRVDLSSDSGVDNSSVGDLSTTEVCACGVPGCNGSCGFNMNVHPKFTNESDKQQINLQQEQIKQLQEQLKKLKTKK